MLVKTKIKQSFSAASNSYDSVALLQRTVGNALLQSVGAIGQVNTVVDLGCGTGFLVKQLLELKTCSSEQVVALDIGESMLHTARNKLKSMGGVVYLCADMENLPFKPQTVDLVTSNLAFQWSGNLDKVVRDVMRVLKPEGRFFFSTFGPSTLHELKNAWAEVDNYAHVNIFQSVAQLTDLLKQAGFNNFEVETRSYVSTYESVWELMAELKQLGAHTVMAGRNKHLTSRTTMNRMIGSYQKQNENGLISATFEVIMVGVRT